MTLHRSGLASLYIMTPGVLWPFRPSSDWPVGLAPGSTASDVLDIKRGRNPARMECQHTPERKTEEEKEPVR